VGHGGQPNAVLTFPSGYAHTFLTWTAGVRKVVYSLQDRTAPW